ncbi:XRE family transcriptional regulator [Streptomyces sp. NPDC002795]|uniref:XRE family transcriptional regulator n=1 Tax=Streptomyces sp. NPDC002795 TaxID=3364665 RepID=UPI0036A7F67A
MAAEETTRRTDLSDLVRDQMKERGLGYRTLAEAAIDPEHPELGPLYTKSTIENLIKNRGVKAPTEGQLRALAAALHLPVSALQRAASAQFFGHVSERWDVEGKRRLFLARIEGIDEEELDELDELAQILLRRRTRRPSE